MYITLYRYSCSSLIAGWPIKAQDNKLDISSGQECPDEEEFRSLLLQYTVNVCINCIGISIRIVVFHVFYEMEEYVAMA